MKKILLSSLLLSSLVLADKIAIPMPASSLAVENSGALSAIDAYQDGVGIYTVEQVGGTIIDNSEMNSLVYKYGAEAKATDVNIKDYILSSGNVAEKILASSLGKFEPITPGNGTVCNDGNIDTSNDKYVNGICVGELPIIYSKADFINFETNFIIIANLNNTGSKKANIAWPWVRTSSGISYNIVFNLGSARTTHIGENLYNNTYSRTIENSLDGYGVIDSSSNFVAIGVNLPSNFINFSTLALRNGGEAAIWKCESFEAYTNQMNSLNLNRNLENTDFCSLLKYSGPNNGVNQRIIYDFNSNYWTFKR